MNTCSTHPRAPAAWVCNQCGKDLCEDCASSQRLQSSFLVRCTHCGGVAEQIMVHKDVTPYWGMLHVFFGRMFKPDGLLKLLLLGLVLGFFNWLCYLPSLFFFATLIVWGIYLGLYASYYFLVLRKAADGEVDLPDVSDFSDTFSLFSTAVRFVLAMGITWIPAMLYIILEYGFWAFLARPTLDPVLIIILIAGLIYTPGAIIIAAIYESTSAVLNPVNFLALVTRIPGQYFVVLFAWIFLTIGNYFVKWLLAVFFARVDIPVVSLVLNETLGMIIPLVGAFMLGRFIFQNGETLGYVRANDMLEPVLPAAQPRHEFQAPDNDFVEPAAEVAPIELSAEVMATPASAAAAPALAAAAASVNHMPVTAELAEDPAASLSRALESGSSQEALAIFGDMVLAGQPTGLDARLEMRLAAMLERAGQSLEAAQACRRAADLDLGGPFASRAIFTAGRLLIEKVGNPDQGVTMLRYLIKHYPNDELSLRADEILNRL